VAIQRGYTEMTPGSVLVQLGGTRVLRTVSVDDSVPSWLRGSEQGWLTAEYSMLPGSGRQRVPRGSISGGRVKEIQRLIGRSLRAAVDLGAMAGVSLHVDCDVLQADGGTRTASITGAWVALADTGDALVASGRLAGSPVVRHVAAVSVGIVGDEVLLDLAYAEDVTAEVDCNVVMTGDGALIEVQGTAEGEPFTRAQLDRMLDVAGAGIVELVDLQKQARSAAPAP
jgi:ribonuclease PH